jgi:predicted nucleotidyltransferase
VKFKRATDHLKQNDRDVIDYYAADLADMSIYILNSWLLLQDARLSERKKAIAEVYIADHLLQIHRAVEAIQTADTTPLEAREAILVASF